MKFVTPPPTPDVVLETEKDQDKPKTIQPKPIKSLANLPIGRKTGGILSLKDKSAGYPHLVNTDPEPKKEEEKKEVKPYQGTSQNSQTYQPKRIDHPPSPNWGANIAPQNPYNDAPRMNFQKNYGVQSPGLTFNPNYPPPAAVNNHGIRLPVVNPKEIDVRTAALQKQNSRPELFQEHKFGNHNYQISGDKKNFLNDLPPRFANQYRYWQNAQENQFNDNKFRDENFKANNNSLFNNQQQRQNWTNPQQMPENYQQPNTWWKPENPPPNFNANYSAPPVNMPNFYSQRLAPNMSSPYPNISYNLQNQSIGQEKPHLMAPNYMQSTIGQPQLQSLQNLVSSPNFNSSLNNFGSYAPPTVGYDSAMYPQFNTNKLGYQPLQMKGKDFEMGGLGFPNVMDPQQRSYNEPLNSDMKNLEQSGVCIEYVPLIWRLDGSVAPEPAC